MAKTVSASKFQEWKGLDRIQRVTHEMHCVYRELSKDDTGIDGEIEVVVEKESGIGFEATGGILKFQSKSGDSFIREDKKGSFSTYVQKEDLEYWYRANFPVLLIVFHPKDDKLYFVEIKQYIRRAPEIFKSPHKIKFDKASNEFSSKSFSTLLQIAGSSPPRVSRKDRERLYSNLLPVKKLPNLITSAPTRFLDRNDVFNEVRQSFPKKGMSFAPFFIKEDRLYTLDDLRNRDCSLRLFSDTNAIDDEWAETWAKDAVKKLDLVYLLNLLLGQHTHTCGLEYSRDYKRNYFPREDKTSLEFRRRWYNVRSGRKVIPRTVVKYYEYGRDKFWRHSAANINFKLIDKSWFLQIIPRYLFTKDGESPCDPKVVGPYSTKLKSQERNMKVLNDVLFWSDVLACGNNEIVMMLHDFKRVIVERTPLSEIADFAVPGDPAVYEDEEEPTDFFQVWDSDDNFDEDINPGNTIYVDEREREGWEDIDAD